MPGVVNCDLLGRHVAAQRRQLRRLAVQPRESHEVRCVRSTAAERPAPRDPVAALRGNGRTHRSGRADNKRVRVGEPRVGDQLGEIPADAAHAAPVADKPPDRAVELGGNLDHAHELDRRQLRPAERLRQPQPKEPDVCQCSEHRVGQPALAVEGVAMLGNKRREPA